MAKTRDYSNIISRGGNDGKRGFRPYSRQEIYQWLYDNSDIRGIVIYSQKEVAEKLGIGYQNISTIYSDFVKIGFMKKHSAREFEVVHHADEVEWTEEILEKLSEIRKVHQTQGDK